MRARTTSRTAEGTRSAAVPARTSSPTKNGLPPERRATAATKSGSGTPPSAAPTSASSHPNSSITSPPSARSRSAGRTVATTSSRPRVTSRVTCASSASESASAHCTSSRTSTSPASSATVTRKRATASKSANRSLSTGSPGSSGASRATSPNPAIAAAARSGPTTREPGPQDPPPRPVRGRALGGRAAAPEHRHRARARQRGQLLGQPRLADPGLPRDHREPGPAVERRVEQRDELGQLVGPSHEPRLHGAEPYREYVVPRISAGQNARTTFDMTRTALRAARLFDGVTTHVDPLVLVEDGRISEVRTGPPPADVEVLDLGEATLLPGLIDTHVHLAFDAGLDPVSALAARDDDAVLESMAQAAAAQLRAGVTTVRDLGDRDYLALRLRESSTGAPDDRGGGPADHLARRALPLPRRRRRARVRDAVREHAERGVDVIKVMASGGFLTSGTDVDGRQFTPDDLAALVDEAHRHGLPVTAHAHALEAIFDGVAAGVDGLEHCTFAAATASSLPMTSSRPSCGAGSPWARRSGSSPTSLPIAPPPELMKILPHVLASYSRLIGEGAVVVAGTDAGIAPVKPHGVLPHGLLHLAQLGMSPAEALTAGTSTAAQCAVSATARAGCGRATTPTSWPSTATRSPTSPRCCGPSPCWWRGARSSRRPCHEAVPGRLVRTLAADNADGSTGTSRSHRNTGRCRRFPAVRCTRTTG